MCMNDPLISIIIPTYNRAEVISESILSALNQTWQKKEIIVIDDGSTDQTTHLIKSFGGDIIYYYQKNSGVSSARNKGISLAHGEYISFLDSDDTWVPEKLEIQVKDLQKNPDCILHLTNAILDRPHLGTVNLFDKNSFTDNFISRIKFPLKTVLHYDIARTQCCLVRRDILQNEKQIFNEKLPIYEDLDFFLRFSLKGSWFMSIDPLTHIMRKQSGASDLSSLRTSDPIKNMLYLINIHQRLLSDSDLDLNEGKCVATKLAGFLRQFGYVLLHHNKFTEGRNAFVESLRHIRKPQALLMIFLIAFMPKYAKSIASRRIN